MRRAIYLLSILVVVFLVGMTYAQQALDNDSIVKMVKAGLSEDIIVSTVKSQPGSYALKADDLVNLKTQGVSDKVLGAMIEKNSGGGTAAPSPSSASASVAAPLVDEIGIYYKKDNKWVEMLPEIVNWKTGGALKSFASRGIVKGDVNGHVEGPKSRNSLTTPLDLLIYTPDGVAITEYQLLHLHENGNSREFRSVTGGVIHASGGAQRDEVTFEGKKLAARTYEILLPATFEKGEYGFLPPGAMSSSNMASSGKIYTFQVLE